MLFMFVVMIGKLVDMVLRREIGVFFVVEERIVIWVWLSKLGMLLCFLRK